jgi:ABC-2 type transport system ATP-binding protein
MADVQALCRRVDRRPPRPDPVSTAYLADLATRFNATKTDRVTLKDGTATDSAYGEVMSVGRRPVTAGSPGPSAAEVATRLLRDLPVADLTIEDPPIETSSRRLRAAPPTRPGRRLDRGRSRRHR